MRCRPTTYMRVSAQSSEGKPTVKWGFYVNRFKLVKTVSHFPLYVQRAFVNYCKLVRKSARLEMVIKDRVQQLLLYEVSFELCLIKICKKSKSTNRVHKNAGSCVFLSKYGPTKDLHHEGFD